MALRDIESTLPPGFRFHPNDEELVCYYLRKKVANQTISGVTLVDVNLHVQEPWELPDAARLSTNEWYFFSFRNRRYATGSRANRATKTGYWKATGKDRAIHEKTLVFYGGRAPNGVKTGWVMHEFGWTEPAWPRSSWVSSAVLLVVLLTCFCLCWRRQEDWVLCRVFNKDKEDTVREDPGNRLDGNDFAFLHPSANHGTTEEYPHQLTLYSTHYHHQQDAAAGYSGIFSSSGLRSGLLDFSPEMETETETPLRLDGGSGGVCTGEFEFFLDADPMGWGTQP
ncbi:unnamed protein product [Spirodela intermedia]|uniref:Uncharacterized protein n=1 Tax=Spirodela intermedia TaxID=51605 RepID=A0A7I8IBX7_SPIIN|nr:unnamed protein product [Spirodela intermedia]CAA6655287.1 unnamed protein product [Spirodela intermedia]